LANHSAAAPGGSVEKNSTTTYSSASEAAAAERLDDDEEEYMYRSVHRELMRDDRNQMAEEMWLTRETGRVSVAERMMLWLGAVDRDCRCTQHGGYPFFRYLPAE
jgi:hypothetical protein